MSQYQSLLEQVQRAVIREKAQRDQLIAVANTLPSRLAEYLGAPPERISIAPRENPDSKKLVIDVNVTFGSNGSVDHTVSVPVTLEVTRHGAGAKVKNSRENRLVGNLPNLEWRAVCGDVAEVLGKDCLDRENKSAL